MRALLLFLIISFPLNAEIIKVNIKGMVCSYCSQGLLKRVQKNPKIIKANIILDSGELQLITNSESVTNEEVEKLVREAGFSVKDIKRSLP